MNDDFFSLEDELSIEEELIRGAGPVPELPNELRTEILTTAMSVRQRNWWVEYAQLAVVAVLLFSSTIALCGYYLSVGRDHEQPDRIVSQDGASFWSAKSSLASMLSITDEWELVKLTEAERFRKSQVLRYKFWE